MNTYTLLFLHTAAQELVRSGKGTGSSYDFDNIAYKTLHSHHLGQYVGAKWNLLDAMLWTPLPPANGQRKAGTGLVETFSSPSEDQDVASAGIMSSGFLPKSPGLYKIQGTTVEGIMGGVFHQFVRPYFLLSRVCLTAASVGR